MLVPREPTTPAPSESGLDEAYESFLAFAASWTINGRHVRFPTSSKSGALGALASIVDFLYISLQDETTLDNLRQDVMYLYMGHQDRDCGQ